MSLRHSLGGLVRVLGGLDGEDDVLSLAVHTHISEGFAKGRRGRGPSSISL